MNVFIVLASIGRKPQFLANFDIWGAPVPAPFTDEGQIWCANANRTSTLTRQISSECVHCVGFRWPKTTILGRMLNFGGLLYRPPFTYEGQMLCAIANPQRTCTCQNLSRSVYSMTLWRRKTPIFAFFGLRHLVTSTVGGSLRKLNTGAQLQTFPYPTASKSFMYPNVFMVKSGAQTLA